MIEVVRTGSAGQRSGRSEGRRLQGWENDALESWRERKEGRKDARFRRLERDHGA